MRKDFAAQRDRVKGKLEKILQHKEFTQQTKI